MQIAAYRLARSNGWKPPYIDESTTLTIDSFTDAPVLKAGDESSSDVKKKLESESLVGFEDLGDALAGDNDYSFLLKLFVGCAVASYVIKYGEIFFDFPYDANVFLGLAVVAVPSALNAFKWYKRSQDPSFEGWF